MPGKTKLYLLHGWSISAENQAKWQDFIFALSKLNIEAEFVLLPGFDTELKSAHDVNDYVQFLVKSLPSHNLNILGHSMGGQLALHLTAQFPDKINRLILLDSSGLRSSRLPDQVKRIVFYVAAKIGKRLTQSGRARHWLYALAREKDYLNASLVMRQTMANLLSHDSHQDASLIRTPSLLIWGENDRVTPLWIAREFMSLIKSAKLHIVKEARHSPQFTHPNQVAQLVAEFLS